MNWGVLGVILVALALGVGIGACWRYGAGPVRWLPIVAGAAYYTALGVWPHPAVQALVLRHTYPPSEQTRVLLLGVALFVVIVLLVRRLHESTRNNATLRAENARLRGNP